jgi:hypothetical protein
LVILLGIGSFNTLAAATLAVPDGCPLRATARPSREAMSARELADLLGPFPGKS